MNACIGDNTVVELIEGKLSVARAALVEQHIARCESCRVRVGAMGTSRSMVENAPTPPVGVGAHLHLKPGMRVGRFTVLHEIGRGGIGVVFAAYDPELERNVALKFLQSAAPSTEHAARARKDMLAEARAMARLAHPGIVTIHEVGTFQDEAFIVMELLPGVTLNDWLRRWNARPWTSIVDIFRQAGQALAHAHAQGLAHGDFKPDNLLVDDSDRVKVMDFGLSRLLDDRAGEGDPLVMGTPRYMAPEQFQGQPSDPRSDQFSFCVALYEALHGEHPFAYDSPMSLLKLPPEQAVREEPSRTDLPGWLRRALQKGLHVDPAKRHDTMDDLLAALAPPVRAPRGRGLVAALTALLVVCFFGYAMGAWYGSPGPTLAGARDDSSAAGEHVPGSKSRRSVPWPQDLLPEPAAAVPDAGMGATGMDAQHERYATWDSRSAEMAIVRYVHQFLDNEIARVDRAMGRVLRATTRQHADSADIADSVVRLVEDVDELKLRQELHEVRIAMLEDDLDRDRQDRSPGETRAAMAEAPVGSTQPEVPVDSTQARANVNSTLAEATVNATQAEGTMRRGQGLARELVRAGIQQRWRDLEVCFREWRERQPRGQRVLAVEFRISKNGRARVSRLSGLSDKVVKQCVSGAIEAARFSRSSGPSVVKVGLQSRGDLLRMVRLRSAGAVVEL